jgi:aryl sulfotransferase
VPDVSGTSALGQTVWLASYPKSGSTWFRAAVAAWRSGDPFDLESQDPIASSRLRFDEMLGLVSTNLSRDELDRLRPRADEIYDEGHPDPHLVKIHDALQAGPDGELIVSVAATRCGVYLVRDPRDVAVSFAHHNDRDVSWAAHHLCDTRGALAARTDDAADQLPQRLGDWSGHIRSWVDRAPFPMHVLRYEDCLLDPEQAFGAALAFAGFELSPDDLVDALERASFVRLRQREAADGFRERFSRHSPFFRRGVAGGWREELDAESIKLIEHCHHDQMVRFGYLPS